MARSDDVFAGRVSVYRPLGATSRSPAQIVAAGLHPVSNRFMESPFMRNSPVWLTFGNGLVGAGCLGFWGTAFCTSAVAAWQFLQVPGPHNLKAVNRNVHRANTHKCVRMLFLICCPCSCTDVYMHTYTHMCLCACSSMRMDVRHCSPHSPSLKPNMFREDFPPDSMSQKSTSTGLDQPLIAPNGPLWPLWSWQAPIARGLINPYME